MSSMVYNIIHNMYVCIYIYMYIYIYRYILTDYLHKLRTSLARSDERWICSALVELRSGVCHKHKLDEHADVRIT